MFIPLALVLFVVIPVLAVWRLHRVPIRGDVQIQLMWRGGVAGVAGGLAGATLSSIVYGVKGYAPVGYFCWLILTALLGAVFSFVVGGFQLGGLNLNLPARGALGGLVGFISAWVWEMMIRADHGRPRDWFDKGVMAMLVCTGIAAGILGGPIRRGDGEQTPSDKLSGPTP